VSALENPMRIAPRESAPAVAPVVPPSARQAFAPRAAGEPTTFESVLRRVGGAIDRDERAMRAATATWSGGDDWSAGDLLSLQAGAYRYSEIVDVASRLVDRTAAAVKTVLQGSGQ
jgi:hypothetical protein